jgi:hypothetical protein
MKRLTGIVLLFIGGWFLVAPQANLGLQELRWMSRDTLPGEALAGSLLLAIGYLLIGKDKFSGTAPANFALQTRRMESRQLRPRI